ncbi:MAG: SpoIIE family protein phosphatase [Streptosporangiaceae bacterium]|nr:SpoIIE family protein phosphatase [Streptosporangiaceae bacterium]MBV9855880.1 SpoIIE family protein phosphatase [Streptosporangiaceae bacterium]
MAGSDEDLLRLAAVVEGQRRELARLRAEAAAESVMAMARGALMARLGFSAAEAARQLADMAAASGLPLPEMAAAVLRIEPGELPEMDAAGEPAAAANSMSLLMAEAAAELARDGTELVAALADQVLEPLGAGAVVVWLLEPDGALEMLGESGLGGAEASRWRHLPPQLDCPAQRVARGGPDLWWHTGRPAGDGVPVTGGSPDSARAVLALREHTGGLLGVLEVCWPEALSAFTGATRLRLSALAAGCAEVLGIRLVHGSLAIAPPRPAVFALLDQVADSVLATSAIRDSGGRVTDFLIEHVSPGFRDPAGRPATELAGLTLLRAYPAAESGGHDGKSGGGLFARAVRVLETGEAQHLPGLLTGPLGAGGHSMPVSDLRIARIFDGVVFSWRNDAETGELAALLDHAQRLGQLGGWEENLVTGAVRWTNSACALFGLAPGTAIPLADLPSYVIAADRAGVRRLRQFLLRQREAISDTFRIVRPDDGAIRQIRIFAEPVADAAGTIVALRGAFQDVSAHYHTQVALAATRDQLADIEQRAAEEHRLAIRLQQAIMPPDEPPVEAAGIDVAVRYRPAGPGHLVGGDWYDTLLLPDKEVMLVVGDVAGHGIDAVTGMVAARNSLRGLATTGAAPAELLSLLNTAACHFTEGLVGTVVCGFYNSSTRLLRWARAGHLPPVLVRGDMASALPLPGGVLLGIDPDAEYEEATLTLELGDTLLLFTDGLIEQRGAAISDALAQFTSIAAPADRDASRHADRLLASAVSDTADDACLVAVRIR